MIAVYNLDNNCFNPLSSGHVFPLRYVLETAEQFAQFQSPVIGSCLPTNGVGKTFQIEA